MFCSATPTLKNRPGKRSANGSTTVKPRSAVSRTMRGSSSASSASVRTNVPLMTHPSFPADLRKREQVLLVVERQVVPLDPAGHERHAAAELGARHDDARSAITSRLLERRAACFVVVSVDLPRLPAERAPALHERLRVEHVARVAECLLAVRVDDRHEV